MPGATDPNTETEWQFEVGDLERVRLWLESQPEHAPLRFALRKDAEQVDSYADTADWRLFFAGYSLRRRRRDSTYELTLKSLQRAEDGLSRREINEESVDGVIPGEAGPVSDRVRMIAGSAPLGRLFEVRTRRRSYTVRQDDRQVALVELDETTVAPQAAPATTFRRVEVEVTERSPDLDSFVQAMRYANGLIPTTVSKFEAGLRAARLDPTASLDFGSTERDPDGGAAEFAYGWLREQWAAFLQQAPGTRLGEDIEALHQMRVATRRLRAAIRVFEGLLPASFAAYRDELQWVGHELGAVRDLDVQIEGLEALRAASSWEDAAALRPLIEVIERERSTERTALLEIMDSTRYASLVRDLSAALRAGPPALAPAPEVGAFARPILAKRFARVRRDGRRLRPESPAAEYHDLRIRGKRLRYSLEIFGDLYGKPAARVTAALKTLQDMLGDHQDAEVGVTRLHEIVARHGRELPPETLVTVGQLIERYRLQERTLRDAFPQDFRRVLRAWPALDRTAAVAAKPRPEPEAPADDAQPEVAQSDNAQSDNAQPEAPSDTAPPPRSAQAAPADPAPGQSPTNAQPSPWSPPASGTREIPPSGDDAGSLSRMRHLFRRD